MKKLITIVLLLLFTTPALAAWTYTPTSPRVEQYGTGSINYRVTLTLSGDQSAATFDASNAANSGTITVTGAFSNLLKIIGNSNLIFRGSGLDVTGPLEIGNNVNLSGMKVH